jgi:hypothetical protein
VLATAAGPVITLEAAEHAEARLLAKKSMWMTKRWRKWRDAPLAEYLEYKLRRRAQAGMEEPTAVQARIERIRRRVR